MRARTCKVRYEYPEGFKIDGYLTCSLKLDSKGKHEGNHEDRRAKNPDHDGVPNWRQEEEKKR